MAKTINEVYAANDHIRASLKSVIEGISEEKARILPEGEKWTLAELVEHIGIVEDGMTKICSKLLNAAKENGNSADGTIKISDKFKEQVAGIATVKVEAPERVRPQGTQTLAESLKILDENRVRLNELKPFFEVVECSEPKFPHPFFGDMTAHEWLVLIGGHEAKHVKQIEKFLEKIS